MGKITSMNVYEFGGPIKPGEMANIVIVATHTNPPIDVLVKVNGFGQEVTYGPYRDFSNPLIIKVPFQIPEGVTVPGTTITGARVGYKGSVEGQPYVDVYLYTLENGHWVLSGSKRVSVNVVGLKVPKATGLSSQPATEKKSSLKDMLIAGAISYILSRG